MHVAIPEPGQRQVVHPSREIHIPPKGRLDPSGARQTTGAPPSRQRGSPLGSQSAASPGVRHRQRRQKSKVKTMSPIRTGVPSGARQTGGGGGGGGGSPSKQSDDVEHNNPPPSSHSHCVHRSDETQVSPGTIRVPSGAVHQGSGGTSSQATPVHESTPPGPHVQLLQPSKYVSPSRSTRPPAITQPPPSIGPPSEIGPPSPGRTAAPQAASAHDSANSAQSPSFSLAPPAWVDVNPPRNSNRSLLVAAFRIAFNLP